MRSTINLPDGWATLAIGARDSDRKIVEAAEQKAQNLGILYAAVETLEFQAREFYEKQGCSVYGVMEDYPHGVADAICTGVRSALDCAAGQSHSWFQATMADSSSDISGEAF